MMLNKQVKRMSTHEYPPSSPNSGSFNNSHLPHHLRKDRESSVGLGYCNLQNPNPAIRFGSLN